MVQGCSNFHRLSSLRCPGHDQSQHLLSVSVHVKHFIYSLMLHHFTDNKGNLTSICCKNDSYLPHASGTQARVLRELTKATHKDQLAWFGRETSVFFKLKRSWGHWNSYQSALCLCSFICTPMEVHDKVSLVSKNAKRKTQTKLLYYILPWFQ